MPILHVISGLGTGGAEHSLLNLLKGWQDSTYHPHVASLGETTPVAENIQALGIPVSSLALKRRPLTASVDLVRLISHVQPALVQGWMYHANLAASVASGLARQRTPVIWSIRHSLDAWREEPAHVRRLVRLGAQRGWRPRRVVYNSEAGRVSHTAHGYGRYPSTVVPNGVDTQRFTIVSSSASPLRRQWQLAPQQRVVGFVARDHVLKDVPTFLGAAAEIASQSPDVVFVMAGRGFSDDNAALSALIDDRGLQPRMRLLGEIRQIETLYPAMDVLLLTSRSEATANVWLEAMASGVPVVSTAVGDAEQILPGDLLAPVGDVGALAARVLKVLRYTEDQRAQLSQSLRARIDAGYSLRSCEEAHRVLYAQVLQGASTDD